MKKLFRSFLFGVILVSMSNLASANLLHRYSFNDGTANDSVGTANGTLMNGATIVDGQLVVGGGAAATGAYLNLPAGAIGINAAQRREIPPVNASLNKLGCAEVRAWEECGEGE